jgi:hypothetical protein
VGSYMRTEVHTVCASPLRLPDPDTSVVVTISGGLTRYGYCSNMKLSSLAMMVHVMHTALLRFVF